MQMLSDLCTCTRDSISRMNENRFSKKHVNDHNATPTDPPLLVLKAGEVHQPELDILHCAL